VTEYEKLLATVDRLLGPEGCPWDQKQSLFSLQKYLIEEAHELIDAIDSRDPQKIVEELGDVLFNVIFIAKIGEKENLFNIEDAAKSENEKLIRRHPHIFGTEKISGVDDVIKNWEKIKKDQEGRASTLSGIPSTLPLLTRVQKIIEKLRRSKNPLAPPIHQHTVTEEEVGKRLWDLIAQAESSNVDVEGALRRYMQSIEKKNTGD
jgi:tetrapyrrole methylase family protein / MazG family protein